MHDSIETLRHSYLDMFMGITTDCAHHRTWQGKDCLDHSLLSTIDVDGVDISIG